MSDVTVSLLVYFSLLVFLAFLVMFSQGFALFLEEIVSLKSVLLHKVIYFFIKKQITHPSINSKYTVIFI